MRIRPDMAGLVGDSTPENRCKTAIPLVGSVGPHGVRVPLRARILRRSTRAECPVWIKNSGDHYPALSGDHYPALSAHHAAPAISFSTLRVRLLCSAPGAR